MPRTKPWIGRLVQITEALESSAVERFTRAEVEHLFGIGRSAASDLMKLAGHSLLSGELTVTRESLLFYLRNSREGQDAMAELARRKKLARTLQKATEEVRLRAIHLPVTSADEWTRFQDLPNVSVEHGILTVAFSDPLDLFTQLYKFAKAAGGEWDVFVKMCEPAIQVETPVVDGDLSQAQTPGNAGAADSGESADAAGGN